MFFFICELHLFNLFYCFQSNKSQIITKFCSCQYESHETRNSVYILLAMKISQTSTYKTRKQHIRHRTNTVGLDGAYFRTDNKYFGPDSECSIQCNYLQYIYECRRISDAAATHPHHTGITRHHYYGTTHSYIYVITKMKPLMSLMRPGSRSDGP